MEKVFAGARVRHLRSGRGMSQVELARLLEISPSYLNQIEHDQRPLTVGVLLRITEAFGVDAEFFAKQDEARLLAQLRETLADQEPERTPTSAELSELVNNHPDVVRTLVGLHRRYRRTVDNAAAALDGRETADGAHRGAPMPYEEVRDFFYERQNYIAELDEVAERFASETGRGGDRRDRLTRGLERHGVRVVIGSHARPEAGAQRTFDESTGVLRLSPHLRPGQQAFQLATQLAFVEHDELLSRLADAGSFTDAPSRSLARIGLANYFAGAVILPYGAFHTAAEETRYDVERLADRFGVGFETICHRLSTLQRPRRRGVPFSFVRVDRAGNMSKRQSATGFHFSHAGGTCPLWIVYEAFSAPGKILTQIAEMPNGRRYFWIARTVTRGRGAYGHPGKTFAIGLGCELRQAHRLIYSTGLDLDAPAPALIGPGCKLCERHSCPQRAFPALGRRLAIAEHTSTFVPYPADPEQAP